MSEQRLDPSRIGGRIEDLLINGAPYEPPKDVSPKRKSKTATKAPVDPNAPVKLPDA
jgi:hypothetical protein